MSRYRSAALFLVVTISPFSACKTDDSPPLSESKGISTSEFTPRQLEIYNQCLSSKKMSDLHCAIYSVAYDNLLEGKSNVQDEEFIERNGLGIKTGDTCQLSFTTKEESGFFGGRIFGTPNNWYHWVYIYPAKRLGKYPATGNLDGDYFYLSNFRKSLFHREMNYAGYWLKYDENFNIISLGREISKKEKDQGKVGSPIWECTITEKVKR